MLSALVQSAVKRDLWAMAEGENNDKPLMIRFRSELRKVEDVSGYPDLLLVNWNYESDPQGLPTESDVEAIDDFEDLLLAALEHDCQTVLVCVITNDGSRQWVFYSSDIHEAETRINSMPQKPKAYPIELLADDDAEWSYFKDNILGECDEAEEPVEGQGERQVVERLALPSAAVGPAERIESTVCRIVRDTLLARRIKMLHNHECQLCGHTISLPDGSLYAEGHHIQPLGEPHNGPDTAENVLCLCPNHHAACDLGAILLAADDLRRVDGHVVGQKFLDYHNRVVYRGGDRA